MRVLIVAATRGELTPLLAALAEDGTSPIGLPRYRTDRHTIDVLVTGVGMVATAVHVARTLATDTFDLALNLGVCGTFDPLLALGRPVHVVTESLAELGAEDGDAFLPADTIGLLDPDAWPFSEGHLVNAAPPSCPALDALPSVSGTTVNTVHGHDASIARVRGRLAPQTESMEGAAFAYACLVAGVRFAQVRTVSNLVERRNRAAWKLAEAIAELDVTARAILEQL